ncbi:hypothetical protein Q3G72_021295 [Acer saccharum]|nr:hypothetical protein Q3G72_021295 [Acer saccharum]
MQRLYKAKKRALLGLAKDHALSFDKLMRYAYMVNQSNSGSAIHISIQEPHSTFHRMFLSFKAKKLCFLEGCKPFVGVDECHLKGPFGGVLVSAVALDANRGLFPLAVCICENETQKGVIQALQQHFPFANRRRMVMRKFQERKEECEQWNSIFPPRVNVKILKNSKQSRVLTIIAVGNMEYKLLGPNEGYTVKLGEYSCQCGSWQVNEIPCRHAIATISHHCGMAVVKDKTNETSTTASFSHQPTQQKSTFEGSSSQPPPTQT